jgi:hypothetical protein
LGHTEKSVKVQFEFSTADLAEVASRTVNRSPLVHRWRLRNSAASAAFAGFLAFAFVPGDMTLRIAAGLFIALSLFVVTTYLLPRPSVNTRTQALYREKLGGDGPFTCEVELTSAGVVARQLGQELHHPWSSIASLSEVPGGIEFICTPIGSLLVRDRAFPDPQVRADFVALARSHIPESAQSEGALERMPERPFVTGPTEREYFVAWLLFFVCVSATGSLASAAIGSGAAAILRMPVAAPAYGVYVFAGISFIATACLSYVFFRLFAKRLVSRVESRPTASAG